MNQKLKPEEKWILLSIPILFILGSLFHCLYEWSGKNPTVALISAINESVWEHNKMVVLPPILLWTIYYLWKGRKNNIDRNKWFTAALGAVITMLITIPLLYYFYTEAFGAELLWVDILILLLANTLGQIVGLHLYRNTKGIHYNVPIVILCFIILLFAFFTHYPPHLPIFMDGLTGSFGLQ